MKTRNWSKVIMDREAWRRIVEQVKIYRVPKKVRRQKKPLMYLESFSIWTLLIMQSLR